MLEKYYTVRFVFIYLIIYFSLHGVYYTVPWSSFSIFESYLGVNDQNRCSQKKGTVPYSKVGFITQTTYNLVHFNYSYHKKLQVLFCLTI